MQANPKRYSSGKFIVSIPGILKILAIIFFLSSSIVFLSTPICPGTPGWYPRLYPILAATSGVVIATLYALYATGAVRKGFAIWNLIDVLFNMFDFILMFTISILTTSACNNSTHKGQLVPGPMGIVGALLLAASSAVWLVQSRSTKEVVLAPDTDVKPVNVNQYRKSVIV